MDLIIIGDEKPEKNKFGFISHQNKFKIDQRFKCKEWNHKSSRKKHEKNLFSQVRKVFLSVNKIQKP